MRLLVILTIYYLNLTLGQPDGCLAFEQSSGLCFGCKANYNQQDLGIPFSAPKCIPKSDVCSSKKVLISNDTDCTGCSLYFDLIYTNIGDALQTLSKIAGNCDSSNFTIFFLGRKHILGTSNPDKTIYLFRRSKTNILIKPLKCNEFNLLGCLAVDEKVEVIIRTDLLLFFVASVLKLENLIFNAVDLQFSKRNFGQPCVKSMDYCCARSEDLRTGLWNISDCGLRNFGGLYNNDTTYGLFNVELIFDNKNLEGLPQLEFKNCEFVNFFLIPQTRFQTIVAAHNPFPFSLIISNVSVAYGLLNRGFLFIRSLEELMLVDSLYYLSNINFYELSKNLSDFARNAVQGANSLYLNDLKFQNLYSPTDFGIAGSLLNIDLISINSCSFLLFFLRNLSLVNIFSSGAESYLFYLNGKVSYGILAKVDIKGVDIQLSQNMSVIRLDSINTAAYNFEVGDFSIKNSLFSSYPPIRIENSEAVLKNFSFIQISSVAKSTLTIVINSGKVGLLNLTMLNTGNILFTFAKSEVTASYLNFVNTTFLTNFFYMLETNFTLINSTLSKVLGSTSLKSILCFASNSDVFLINSTLNEVFALIVFDFRLVRSNVISSFNISKMNGISYFYSLDSSFKLITIENSNITDSSFEHIGYWLAPALFVGYKPSFFIKNTNFKNFLCLNAFFSAFSKIDVTFESSVFYNFTSRSDGQLVRFWFIARESILTLLNCIFERNGFEYEPTKVNYPANYPLFLITYTSRAQVKSTRFRNDEKVSLVSGFIILAYLTSVAEIVNCTFEAVNRNPKFTYHGLIMSVVQSVLFKNNTVKNLGCPAWTFSSQFHFNAVVTFQGEESDRFLLNKKDAWIEGNFFQDCKCVRGAALYSSNYHNLTCKDNIFVNNQAVEGGAFAILSSSNVVLSFNQISNSKANVGGAGFILDVVNFTALSMFISNCSAVLAGSISFENVNLISCSLFSVNNSKSQSDGGFTALTNSRMMMRNSTFINLASGANGGFVVLFTFSSLFMIDSLVYNSSAYYGGAISVLIGKELLINETIFLSVSSLQDGAVILLDSISTLKLNNISIRDSQTAGSGIILIKTTEEEAQFYMNNLSCIGNSAKLGSCLYFNSPGILTVQGLYFTASFGNVLKFFWTTKASIIIEGIFAEYNKIADSMIMIQGLDVKMKSCRFISNFLLKNMILIKNSFLQFNECLFFDNSLLKYSQETTVIIIQSQFSNFSGFNLNITNTGPKSGSSIFLQAKQGLFNFEQISISNISTADKSAFYFELSDIVIRRASFKFNTGKCLEMVNSYFQIIETNFSENTPVQEDVPTDIYYNNKAFGNFKGRLSGIRVDKLKSNGTAFLFKNLASLEIIEASFNGSNNEELVIKSARGMLMINIIDVTLEKVLFYNIRSLTTPGAAFQSLTQADFITETFRIFNSQFVNCSSEFGGAVVHISNALSVTIMNSKFESNRATEIEGSKDSYTGVGACGIVTCKDSGCLLILRKNLFSKNFAEYHSPLFAINTTFIDEFNILEDNYDEEKFSERFTVYPIDLKLVIDQEFSKNKSSILTEVGSKISLNHFESSAENNYIEASSGASMNLTFTLNDHENQLMIFEKSSKAIIEIETEGGGISIANAVGDISNGKILFKNFKINAKPGSFVALIVTFTIPPYIGLNSYTITQKKILYFKLSPCLFGEIMLTDFTCYKCPEGFYSIIDPMSVAPTSQRCEVCMVEAVCPGGWMVFPAPGFWRPHNNTLRILECPISESCVGPHKYEISDDQKLVGGCLQGHSNNLCFECDVGFARMSSTGICVSCSSERGGYITRFVAASLFIVLYAIGGGYVYSNQSGESNTFGYIFVFVKMTVSFSQIVNLLTFLKINWVLPTIKDIYSSGSETASFSLEDIILNECLLEKKSGSGSKDSSGQFSTKIAVVVTLPIVLFIASSFIWLGHFFLKRLLKLIPAKSYKKAKKIVVVRVFACLVISIFLFQPLIIKSSFNLLNCMNLDSDKPSKTFLKTIPVIECWTSSHFSLILLAFVPSIIIWGLGFPIFLMIALMKQQQFKATYKSKKTINQKYSSSITHQSSQTTTLGKKSLFEQKITLYEATKYLGNSNKAPTINDSESHNVNNYTNNGSTRQQKTRSGVFTSLYKSNVFKFLYFGYKDQYTYWECLVFLKKFLISMLVNTNTFLGSELASLLIFAVLFISLYLQYKYRPYSDSELNIHESSCQLASIAIFGCVIVLSTSGIGQYGNGFTAFLLLLCFLIILLLTAFFVVKSLLRKNILGNLFLKLKKSATRVSKNIDKKTTPPVEEKIVFESIM